MHAEAAYAELIRRTREETLLASCAELLAWDEETYLPPRGVAHRADQQALLSGLLHERSTHPRVGELLAELEGSMLVADPTSAAAINVREIRREYQRLVRLPRAHVEEEARVTAFAQQEWAAARQQADFARFHPWLAKIVALKRREAECLGYEGVAYDALLDEHDPGARSEALALLFGALREELVPLVNALSYAARRPDVALLRREFPSDRQRLLSERAAAALGFDFQTGRLDTTTHPFFAAIGPGDCRIATRFNPHHFCEAFFATLHEVGHALYEQGLDPEHHGTPLGEAPSLAVHESQARLWENAVGRSLAFWQHFFPIAAQICPTALRDVRLDDFHFAINNVEPTFARASADEVTYNLHILIRFDLERALIAGDLQAGDVPTVWNESYRHHLGITPANDAEGCLQDGHWGAGLIGYFPTYTLGNLYAAQLLARACTDLGELDSAFARGDFSGLLGWLRDRIHRQGSRYSAAGLIEQATGSAPDHRPFVKALRQKYGELYGI